MELPIHGDSPLYLTDVFAVQLHTQQDLGQRDGTSGTLRAKRDRHW